eukprot:3463330-Prymnesium_polylepis.1
MDPAFAVSTLLRSRTRRARVGAGEARRETGRLAPRCVISKMLILGETYVAEQEVTSRPG